MSEILSREEFKNGVGTYDGEADEWMDALDATVEALAAMLSWVDPSPIDGESPADEMDELEEKGWLS